MQILSLLLAGIVYLASAQNIAYSPASGYFLCPNDKMVCNVKGCNKDDKCSIITNGFRKTTLRDGTDVFKSEQAHASLSITGGEGTFLTCDVSCQCQMITSTLGCSVQPPIPDDADRAESEVVQPFAEGLRDEDGEQYANFEVSSTETEESKANSVPVGVSILLGFLVPILMD